MAHLDPTGLPPEGDRRALPTRRSRDADAIERRVREAVTVAARDAATRAARTTARRAAGGYFVLLLVLIIGAQAWGTTSDRRSCERVNTLRVEEANRSAQVMWAALMASRDRSQTLAHETVGEAEHATHTRAVREITKYADAMRWTPRTNCAAAHPFIAVLASGYTPPTPRPFTKRFRDLRVVPQ